MAGFKMSTCHVCAPHMLAPACCTAMRTCGRPSLLPGCLGPPPQLLRGQVVHRLQPMELLHQLQPAGTLTQRTSYLVATPTCCPRHSCCCGGLVKASDRQPLRWKQLHARRQHLQQDTSAILGDAQPLCLLSRDT